MTTAIRAPRSISVRGRLPLPRASTVAFVVTVGLAAAAAVLRIVHRGHIDSFFTNGWLAVEVTVALVYAPAGALILRRGGSRIIGALFLMVAAGNALSAFATEYGSHGLYYAVGSVPEPALVSSLQSWIWLPGNLLLATLVPLLLPDGRLQAGRRWQWFATAAVAGTLLRLPDHATNAWPWPLGPSASPLGVTNEAARSVLSGLNAAGMALVVVAAVGGLLSLRGHLRAGDAQRQAQLRWLLAGTVAVVVNVAVDPVSWMGADIPRLDVATQVLQVIALPLLPVTAAVAVLRHRLWGIDAVVNRVVFWLAASAAVLVVYAASVILAGLLLGRTGVTASAAAAGLVAVLFQPLRTRLQASVDRVVYGERGDPLAVVRRLGTTLRSASGPDTALQQVADTLGQALHLEMVAIELQGPDGGTRVAEWGPPTPADATVPLTYRGEEVGRLLIGCRPGDELGPRFRAALDDLSPQLAAATAASRFEHELVRANRRILKARDDERLRLRRDLHDGLGPALAGMALSLTAARNHLRGGDSERVTSLLDEISTELEHKVAEVRAIVYGLRPPQLDDLGLFGAIEHHLRRYAACTDVSVHVAGELPELPAAIESAVYNVVVGAVDNTIRHAGARTCTVLLAPESGELRVQVSDDGRGVRGREGVGIRAMRERVAAVDGVLSVRPGAVKGTTVEARVPLGANP